MRQRRGSVYLAMVMMTLTEQVLFVCGYVKQDMPYQLGFSAITNLLIAYLLIQGDHPGVSLPLTR